MGFLKSSVPFISAVLVSFLLTGCNLQPRTVQGYVEGKFVYVAPAVAGQLRKLDVERGSLVKTGDPLFELDDIPQKAELAEAVGRLEQAEAAYKLSEQEIKRQEQLLKENVATQEAFDLALSTRDQAKQSVIQNKALLEKARWNMSQVKMASPKDALVFDTLYREGEWVGAGTPIVTLLPPENVLVRAFVSNTQLAKIHYEEQASIFVDGLPTPFYGKVTFIAPQAEYTPPVIYSKENREKFVYLVEVSVDASTAKQLHVGQPVDVRFE